MAKIGDTVRFLNSVGGGKITRIEGKMAYVVDEDGFDTPVLLSELVVVLPAGSETNKSGAKLMFDQKAFDDGRSDNRNAQLQGGDKEKKVVQSEADKPMPETPHGNKLNIVLAFEPSDLRKLSESSFNAVLVNDSNYRLDFAFSGRADGDRGWTLIYNGSVAANELIDLAQFTHADLGRIERVALQCVAYKENGSFELKPAFSVTRRLDLTKFHKLHCFRPGLYFETPVIEVRLVRDDAAEGDGPVMRYRENRKEDENELSALVKKYSSDPKGEQAKKRVDERARKVKPDPADNPHKLLDIIEVDLHIDNLTDTIAGLKPSDMLEMQLEEVRKTMKAHSRRKGQKIVFIHGKGEGVLRKNVVSLLKKEYPKAELQDASFQEYGFGATLVTIH